MTGDAVVVDTVGPGTLHKTLTDRGVVDLFEFDTDGVFAVGNAVVLVDMAVGDYGVGYVFDRNPDVPGAVSTPVGVGKSITLDDVGISTDRDVINLQAGHTRISRILTPVNAEVIFATGYFVVGFGDGVAADYLESGTLKLGGTAGD